ncbi:MAG: hypothetical protein Q9M40_07275 [Sulfurimonas sp.]|nr:hypothetical protein [Sulfurimonas sp.]
MENKCENCEHFNQCEIMIRVHNSIKKNSEVLFTETMDVNKYADIEFTNNRVTIIKGQRIAQITLLEHKAYLFGIDTEEERTGGFGSTDEKDI